MTVEILKQSNGDIENWLKNIFKIIDKKDAKALQIILGKMQNLFLAAFQKPLAKKLSATLLNIFSVH